MTQTFAFFSHLLFSGVAFWVPPYGSHSLAPLCYELLTSSLFRGGVRVGLADPLPAGSTQDALALLGINNF